MPHFRTQSARLAQLAVPAHEVPLNAHRPPSALCPPQGTFEVRPAQMAVTYWPDALDGDPSVRQCTCLGQAVGMARWGQGGMCGSGGWSWWQ